MSTNEQTARRFEPFIVPDRLTTNKELAHSLSAAGLRVFPCRGQGGPDGKNPCPGVLWQGAPARDPRRVERWWTQWPDAMPGINTIDLRILFVDLDGEEGIAQWDALCTAHGYVHAGPRTRTPGGGWHLAFIVPEGMTIGNGLGSLPAKKAGGKIDIRGPGAGYVIASGSDTCGWGVYAPEDGNPLAMLDAPPMPAWLIETLASKAVADMGNPISPPPAPPPAGSPARHSARIEAWAEAAFEAEIAALADCGKGGRNIQLNTSAHSLFQLVAGGYLDGGRVHAALLDAATSCGIMQDDGRPQCEKTIRSAKAGAARKPRSPPADIAGDEDMETIGRAAAAPALRARDGTPADPETGELLEEDDEDEEPSILAGLQQEMPDHLLRPPGLVGRLAWFIDDSARKPIPTLSLAAALIIVGTASGRYWCGPTKTSQGMFVTGLAPSGAGKDHPLKSVRRILAASGMGLLVGSDELTSHSGMVRSVIQKPVQVMPMDEYGAFLKKVLSKKASSHEAGISKIFRTLASVHTDVFSTPATAQGGGDTIDAPQISVFGVTVEEDFFAAIGGSDVSNGLINRMLYAGTNLLPTSRDPLVDADKVPPDIVDRLLALWGGGNEGSRAITMDPGATIDHRAVEWDGPDAKALWQDFQAEQDKFCEQNPQDGRLFVRTAEHAIRLATIIALGENALKPTVSVSNVRWGCAVARWSAQSMLRATNLNLADTDAQRDAKIVLRAILAFKKQRVRRMDVAQSIKLRFKSRDLNELLATLVDGGRITLAKDTAPGAKRPTEWICVRKSQ